MTFRVDAGRIAGKIQRTPQGGIRVPATLTRCGVFTYTQPDGSKIRELRHPDEVFAPESLATLAFAPVVVGHPSVITDENYTTLAKGHTSETVTRDNDRVQGSIFIQDKKTKGLVLSRDLIECSLGYSVNLDFTPGEYQGERYDAVQRNIRYNHVGLGPKNWGRAGSEVRIHLDSVAALLDSKAMPPPVEQTVVWNEATGEAEIIEDSPVSTDDVSRETQDEVAKADGGPVVEPVAEPVVKVITTPSADPEQIPAIENKDLTPAPKCDGEESPIVGPSTERLYSASEIAQLLEWHTRAPKLTRNDAGELRSLNEIQREYVRENSKLDCSGKTEQWVAGAADALASVSRETLDRADSAARVATAKNPVEKIDRVREAREKMLAANAALNRAGC